MHWFLIKWEVIWIIKTYVPIQKNHINLHQKSAHEMLTHLKPVELYISSNLKLLKHYASKSSLKDPHPGWWLIFINSHSSPMEQPPSPFFQLVGFSLSAPFLSQSALYPLRKLSPPQSGKHAFQWRSWATWIMHKSMIYVHYESPNKTV